MQPDAIVAADPHGAAMLDHLDRCYDGSFSYVRNDGVIGPFDIARRFGTYSEFDPAERRLCDWARGRVLDVGCGSGKHLVALRDAGHACVGIDNSPVVRRLWRRTGMDGVCVMDAFRLGVVDGTFDTVTLFANGLSMGGTIDGVAALLAELRRVTGPNSRVGLTNVAVGASTREVDQRFHERNLAVGRPAGALTLRARYRGIDGPPFPWLLLGPDELAAVAARSGWAVGEVDQGLRGAYAARLDARA